MTATHAPLGEVILSLLHLEKVHRNKPSVAAAQIVVIQYIALYYNIMYKKMHFIE